MSNDNTTNQEKEVQAITADGESAESPISTVVEKDAIDALMFDAVRDASKVADICEADQVSEVCMQDAFTSFFTHNPKTIEECDPAQKGVLDTFLGLDEFKNLRAGTQHDEMTSALAALQFAPNLIEQVKKVRKQMEEKRQEAQAQNKAGPQNMNEALSERDMAAMRQAMRRGLEKAQEATDDYKDALSAWGVNKGDLQRVPAEKRLELANRMIRSNKLKKISDLVGRFKNIVHSAAAQAPVHAMDEIVDIKTGNDLGRILPGELVKMVESPTQFMMDFLEKKLLTYEMKGVEDLGRGPIIACLDISGSMNDDSKEEWAKAVVLALMTLAEKQKRSFGFIAFNEEVAMKRYFPKEMTIGLEDKIQIAEIVSTGGTNFFWPFHDAFEFRRKEPSLKPADVVFITDGEADLSPEALSEILVNKEQTGVRIYSIGIAGSHSMNMSCLRKISDQVNVVNQLGDLQVVKDLMTSTASSQGIKTASVGGVKQEEKPEPQWF